MLLDVLRSYENSVLGFTSVQYFAFGFEMLLFFRLTDFLYFFHPHHLNSYLVFMAFLFRDKHFLISYEKIILEDFIHRWSFLWVYLQQLLKKRPCFRIHYIG